MTISSIQTGPEELLLQPATSRPARQPGLRDRMTEQAVVLSTRPEPLAVLVLLFLVWMALQVLKLAGRAL